MIEQPEEPILPRLLASNALRANLRKIMNLNQMADNKASMIMTVASLIGTITITQTGKISVLTAVLLLFYRPPCHFVFHSRNYTSKARKRSGQPISNFALFVKSAKRGLSARGNRRSLTETVCMMRSTRNMLFRRYQLTRKYALLRNGLLALLLGLMASGFSMFLPGLI